VRSLSWA